MLMQNFKTAEGLGITEPQKDALIKTLVLLETGKMVHVSLSELEFSDRFVPYKDREFSYHFNMGDWCAAHSCGTACCIGGTAEMIGGLGIGSFDDTDNSGLRQLFFPNAARIPYSRITPSQAATALRSYLTTGDARWDLAVS